MNLLQGKAIATQFQIRVGEASLEQHARLVLGGLLGSVDATSRVRTFDLSVEGDQNGFSNLLSDLTYAAIADSEGSLLLHAGAVANADGGTAVLCGPSGSGKSTLTTRLVRAGFHYVTDETVCAHPVSLRIEYFRRPVSLKPGSPLALRGDWPSIQKRALRSGECWFVPPDDLGGAPAPTSPLWPALFVFPTFVSGAPCAVERLTEAHTAFLLGQNSSRLRQIAQGPLATLSRAARRAPGFEVRFGSVDDAADAVADLLHAS